MATGEELPDPHGRSWYLMPGKRADKRSHVNHWDMQQQGTGVSFDTAKGAIVFTPNKC